MPLEEVGGDLGRPERRAAEHLDEQVAVRADAVDLCALERGGEPAQRRVAGRRPGHHLGQHRVVVGADLVAGHEPGVEPDPGARERAERDVVRHLEAGEPAALRLPVAGRVLGVEPDLDRVPGRLRGRRHAAALGHQQLLLHEVETGHQLGDRVLDLQPGVGLEEEEARRRRAGTPRCRRRRSRSPRPPPAPRRAARHGRRRPAPARVPPRRPSGGGAAPSSPGRRARRRRRGCRRAPAPRRAGRARRTARRTRSRRRTRTAPPARPARRSAAAGRGAAPRASRGHRRPRTP